MSSTNGQPQVVVVTGASAGLGRAIAQKFGARGARVALIARSRPRLEQAKAEIEALGGTAMAVPLDVADAEGMERCTGEIEETLGPIDVWINNAMVSVYSPIKEMTADEFRRVTEVNYLGYVYGTLAALKRMLPRDEGVIIQVGSALAYRAIPLQSAYCATKHAIVGFTESLRSELIHDSSKVRVSSVHMPALNTPQFDWVRSRLPNKAQPVPPIFQPEVGAEAVVYAVDHDVGRELHVGWPTIKAILGDKVIPGLLDHYLATKAYEGQQTDEPREANAPENLFETVSGDYGAHGRFDERAKPHSAELWLRMHRGLLAVAGAGVAALALGALGRRSRRQRSRAEADREVAIATLRDADAAAHDAPHGTLGVVPAGMSAAAANPTLTGPASAAAPTTGPAPTAPRASELNP